MIWSADVGAATTKDNDKIQLICVLFCKENNDKLYRLSQGVSNRVDLNDPLLSLKAIFQIFALDFNNSELKMELPPEASDINGSHDLDPNDASQLRIKRDCR